MADKITQKDVIDSSVVKGILELNTELTQSVKLMADLTREAVSFRSASNPQNIQQVISAQKQSNDISEKSIQANKRRTESLTALGKERLRVENQKKKILAQTLSLEEKGTKTLIKGQERLKIARKAAREEAQKALGVSKKSNGMFKSMTKSLIAFGATTLSIRAVFNIFKSSIQTISSFEEAMSKVRAVSGALPKDFKALQENAKLLGATTSKTATEVAGLQLEFAKLGFGTKDILNATEATISLSIAAGSDLAESAKVAASTLNGFGLSATESKRVVDVMAKSFSSSALDLSKFQTAMANAQIAAKVTGRTIEETTAFLSVLSDTGVEASKAGTDLRVIFSKLAIKGIDLNKAMDDIEKSSNKVATAQALVGDRAFSSLITLSQNREKTLELTEAYNNAAGSAEEMARVMEDNLIGDTKKLSSAWEGFILGLNKGEGAISKTLRTFTQGITNIITNLTLVNKTGKELEVYLANLELTKNMNKDAKRVEIIAEKLAESRDKTEAWSKSVEIVTNALQKLKGENEGINMIIDQRIDALNSLITINENVVSSEETTTEETEKEYTKREDIARQHEIDLMKLTEKRYAELDRMAKESEVDNINSQDESLDEWFKLEEEALDERIKLINEETKARLKADEIRRESIRYYTSFALNEAQHLSNSVLGLLENQINAQRDADIQKAESRGASEAEIMKIERKAANERKTIAYLDLAINTALAVTKAWVENSWVEALIISAAIIAEGAVQVAAIESASFAKGTQDSGSNWLDATVSEKGTEKVILADGSSFFTPEQQTKMLLPPHSQVIPNHQLQNELAEIQAYGSKSKYIEENKRQEELTKELIKTVRNKKETTLNITENGVGVTAKKGNDWYKYLARKYKD